MLVLFLNFICSAIVVLQFLTTIWYMSVVYRDFTFPKAFRYACMDDSVQCHCRVFILVLKSCSTATSLVCSLPSSCSSSFTRVYSTATSTWCPNWLVLLTGTSTRLAHSTPQFQITYFHYSPTPTAPPPHPPPTIYTPGLVDMYFFLLLLSQVEHTHTRLDKSLHLPWL